MAITTTGGLSEGDSDGLGVRAALSGVAWGVTAAPAPVQATAAAPTRQVTPSTPRHRVARLVIIGPLLCCWHTTCRFSPSFREDCVRANAGEVVILAPASGQASGPRRCG